MAPCARPFVGAVVAAAKVPPRRRGDRWSSSASLHIHKWSLTEFNPQRSSVEFDTRPSLVEFGRVQRKEDRRILIFVQISTICLSDRRHDLRPRGRSHHRAVSSRDSMKSPSCWLRQCSEMRQRPRSCWSEAIARDSEAREREKQRVRECRGRRAGASPADLRIVESSCASGGSSGLCRNSRERRGKDRFPPLIWVPTGSRGPLSAPPPHHRIAAVRGIHRSRRRDRPVQGRETKDTFFCKKKLLKKR